MIALVIGLPAAARANVVQLACDALTAPARHLQLVQPALPIATGTNGMQTVAQFCAARGTELTIGEMNRIGRRAAALSRQQDRQIVKVPCPLFGEVNSYSPTLLAQAFDEIVAVLA